MLVLVALTIVFLLPGPTTSQVTYPPCTATGVDWTYNSISQNPCEVASYMQSTCHGGSFGTGALPAGYYYAIPGPDDSDLCMCNTVTYSLLSACAACQGGTWLRWTQWATDCTAILPPSTFPQPVPPQIRVPQWALIDVTLENNWNANNSMFVGGSPEIGPGVLLGTSNSSANSSATSSTGIHTVLSTTTNLSNVTSSTAVPSVQDVPSTSVAGRSIKAAIVGGVVGGLAFVVIAIVALGIWLTRRQRSKARSDGLEIDVETSESNDGAVAWPAPAVPTLSVDPTRNTSDHLTPFPWRSEDSYVPNVSVRAVFGSPNSRHKR